MSYAYRERDREWDEYSRPSEHRGSYTVKRYVIPSDDGRDRERDFFRREDSGTADRELVIRRRTEPHETDYEVRREYREHEPRSIYEPDYQVVHRSEVERDPRDVEYYYQRRVREYDDDRDRIRREISPHDSVSQVSTRRRRDRDRDRDYSSDDSMVYIRKETREYDDEPHHHKRHLAEGALLAVGAAELLRHRSKSQGREVTGGVGRVGRDVGAAALGAIAANAVDHYRSKSRRRSSSVDDDDRRHRRHHRHSRSRSSSHSRAKTLAGIGLGAAALAGAVALARNKSQDDRRSRSRHRQRSQSRGGNAASRSKSRNRHMAAAGLAGAAAAGLIERARSKSRSRSKSRIRQGLPIVAAGLGSAAAAGLYENFKAKRDQSAKGERRSSRTRSTSRSRGPILPDPARESAGLIEYGHDPVYGNIPAADYYGRPNSQQGYYNDAVVPAVGNRDGRDRGYSTSSSGSDRSHRRRHRRREKKERSSSRIRDLAEAGLAAAGLGYAASKISGNKKDKSRHSRERESRRHDHENDSYEEPYDPAPYMPTPPPGAPVPPTESYYPYTNSFPPPPGSTPNPPPASYHPREYPPPPAPGAVPPPMHGYPPPPGAPPGNEPYAPQPRRADENVSAPFLDSHHKADGVRGSSAQPSRTDLSRGGPEGNSRRRSMATPNPIRRSHVHMTPPPMEKGMKRMIVILQLMEMIEATIIIVTIVTLLLPFETTRLTYTNLRLILIVITIINTIKLQSPILFLLNLQQETLLILKRQLTCLIDSMLKAASCQKREMILLQTRSTICCRTSFQLDANSTQRTGCGDLSSDVL
ncbi:uncharacterized protein BHQ10_007179 [Talaromyces amestolkiae]|uniref:DUF3824 domain-containing protein n=1 Tax=Talaromyces amestolkiae TaxID=1196081 RepID=A0A364L5S8_TALAM|nr:uncharacterized protein BHQ10_007179 [Talaromyces amestolkiae]RAO71167.1 hypothetical protein BHQ10_007179 [Talaromyces amestolkiae]